MSVKKKPLVVVTRKLPDSIETRMRELFDARLNLDDTPMTPEQITDAVRTADVLVPTVTDMINEEMLKHPDCKLRMIANFGNGVDNIDVTAAHARGITVTNTPKVLTEDTADMTMALILAVPRRLIEHVLADHVGHGRHQYVGGADGFGDLLGCHRRVVEIEPCVEQLTHPGLDRVRQLAGNDDERLFLHRHVLLS